jgi:hypothetical protein
MFARRSPSVRRASAGRAGAGRAEWRERQPLWLSCLLASACSGTTPATQPPTAAPVPAPSPTPAPEPASEAGSTPAPPPRPAPALHIDTSDAKATHYLLELPLRLEDLVLAGPLMQREMAYTFVDGGQFELYVKPSVIPARNPGCEAIIVRMPWTNPELRDAAAAVEVKQKLFSRVVDLVQGRITEVPIVVQLDPYVEAAGSDRKDVSLTRCEVFFRHAPETFAYVDHLGP